MNKSINVFELVELLLPFMVPIVDDTTDQAKPTLYYRTPTAETNHRRYIITGVRTGSDGDPVIEIEFVD